MLLGHPLSRAQVQERARCSCFPPCLSFTDLGPALPLAGLDLPMSQGAMDAGVREGNCHPVRRPAGGGIVALPKQKATWFPPGGSLWAQGRFANSIKCGRSFHFIPNCESCFLRKHF